MTEVINRIEESMAKWKPEAKRRPQTMADIDETAALFASLNKSLRRHREKQGQQPEENRKDTFFGLFLAILGAILTSGAGYVFEGTEQALNKRG